MTRRHAARRVLAGCAAALLATTPVSAGQVLMAEPVLTLAQNFLVAATSGPPTGQFMLVQWQPNPLTANHLDVPVTAPLSRVTGFAPPPPFSLVQAGVANRPGATGVQIYGKTLGINMSSADFLPGGTQYDLISLLPGYIYPVGSVVLPFTQAGSKLVFALQAQVPTASVTPPPGNPAYNPNAYISFDIVLQDTTHPATPQITVGVLMFSFNHFALPVESITFDPVVDKILVHTEIESGLAFSTLLPTSQRYQAQTWSGFRSFQATITSANMTAIIKAIQGSSALLTSLGLTAADFAASPASYSVVSFHVNSEMNYTDQTTGTYSGGSVQMGLAIRNMQLSAQDANDCATPHNGVDGTLGLEDGDTHFLCVKSKWYLCDATRRAWATTATIGTTYGPYMCSSTGWVPAP